MPWDRQINAGLGPLFFAHTRPAIRSATDASPFQSRNESVYVNVNVTYIIPLIDFTHTNTPGDLP